MLQVWQKFFAGAKKNLHLQELIAIVNAKFIFENMSHTTHEHLLAALNWRYATKHFDADKKIPADVWTALEKTLVLTPTSFGLQPYKFFVVENPSKRAELFAHSWHQKQVVDASHYVVFTARTHLTEADVDKFINRAIAVRQLPADALDRYRDVIIKDVVHGGRGTHAWATHQTYIALGNLMTAAAMIGVDASPMEGLAPKEYDKILGLENSGYATVVACALGYRSVHDKYAGMAKIRFEAKEVIQYI
jgi:nitroreductase